MGGPGKLQAPAGPTSEGSKYIKPESETPWQRPTKDELAEKYPYAMMHDEADPWEAPRLDFQPPTLLDLPRKTVRQNGPQKNTGPNQK